MQILKTLLIASFISAPAFAINKPCDFTKVAQTTPEHEQKVLAYIEKAKAADEKYAKLFEENPKLVPFNDYFEEYGKEVITPSEKMVKMIEQGRNKKIINAYFDFESQFLKNFKNHSQNAINKKANVSASALNHMYMTMLLKSQKYHELYDCDK